MTTKTTRWFTALALAIGLVGASQAVVMSAEANLVMSHGSNLPCKGDIRVIAD